MTSERPVVVGMGLCSACGNDCAAAFDALLAKRDFLAPQKLFDSPKHGSRLFAQAKGFHEKKPYSRCVGIMLSAVGKALENLDIRRFDKRRICVFGGTSIGGVFETENALSKLLLKNEEDLGALRFYECSSLADIAAKKIGAKGCAMTFSTACSSSSLALAAACDAISQKEADLCLVFGADALSRITINGFGSLLLLSKDKCKPFDKDRDGINLGEAAGALVLASESAAMAAGLKVLAHVASWACNADAYHPTAPRPDGDGVKSLISKLISSHGMGNIASIAAHGTGTAGNDSAEYAAFRDAFGENIPAYYSNKRLFGHTLGASGAVNAIMGICSLNGNILPPTPGFSVPLEGMDMQPLKEPSKANIDSVLTLSLGFGGNNAGTIFAKDRSSKDAEFFDGQFFVHSVGVSSPKGASPEEIENNISKAGPFRCDEERNLESIPPLKKRKLARLQKMALSACIKAAEGAKGALKKPLNTSVCIGTGLGMTNETAKFIENVILNREAMPMPTAFTNSVHNAPSSAAAIHLGFRGLNSAVTAKEISFESALWQAMADMRSGNSSCAIVGAADEYSPYADKFLKTRARYCRNFADNLSEGAAAYAISADRQEGSIAKIILLKLERRGDSPKEEGDLIERLMRLAKVPAGRIKCCFTPSIVNKSQKKFFDAAAEKIAPEETCCIEDLFGKSYMNSAYAIMLGKLRGRGVYALWSHTSSNLRAFTIFEIL